MNAKEQYHASLDLIQKVINRTTRRHVLTKEDAEDFSSQVHMKLMEDDYRILRRFQQKSSLSTFLCTVIQRLYQDFRNHQWGKWRLSAQARRRGWTAELLETLMVRDEYDFEQAFEIITTNHSIKISKAALAELAADLPPRMLRKQVPVDHLDIEPVEGFSHDDNLTHQRWLSLQTKTEKAMNDVLAALTTEDRMILKMFFKDGFTVVRIAKLLQRPSKPLYRHIEKLLRALRSQLENQGVQAEQVTEIIGQCYGSIRINFEAAADNKTAPPSRTMKR